MLHICRLPAEFLCTTGRREDWIHYWVSCEKREVPTEGMAVAGRSVHALKKVWLRWRSWHSQEGRPYQISRETSLSQSLYTATLVWRDAMCQLPCVHARFMVTKQPIHLTIHLGHNSAMSVPDTSAEREWFETASDWCVWCDWSAVEQNVIDYALSSPVAQTYPYACIRAKRLQSWIFTVTEIGRNVTKLIEFKTAVLVYKCLHGMAPYCTPVTSQTGRSNLRSATTGQLIVPGPGTRTAYGSRSFAVHGPVVWNSLPAELRSPDISLDVFRKQLKTFLFNYW